MGTGTGRTEFPRGTTPRVSVDALAGDDYGIDSAYLALTIASGRGEQVKFERRTLAFALRERRPDGGVRLGTTLDLAALGLGPGDELYFHVEATDRKVGWVRAGAGARAGAPELQVRVHVAMVTADRDAVIDELAPTFGLTPDEARTTPHALVGSVDQICDQLVERRERWGISYLGLSDDQLDAFAPVVGRLSGT